MVDRIVIGCREKLSLLYIGKEWMRQVFEPESWPSHLSKFPAKMPKNISTIKLATGRLSWSSDYAADKPELEGPFEILSLYLFH